MRCNQVWLCARVRAAKVGYRIKRIAAAFGAGRDGFWLARWLTARDIEAQVISHPVFMFRRASSAIKPAQTGGDGPRLPGILTPIFVVISRRIHWTRGGHNDVQRISFRD